MSDVADWWKTSIIDMEPGRIELRGQPIQDLIGNISFHDMIWMMVRGDRPLTHSQNYLRPHWYPLSITGPKPPQSRRRAWR